VVNPEPGPTQGSETGRENELTPPGSGKQPEPPEGSQEPEERQ
jgi:hypothetical protein